MVTFAVSKEKNKWLQKMMDTMGIYEKDIIEKFVKSSGRGGQKVNKSSTCVYLKHIPTGIEVKCMKYRNQSINRFLARRKLLEKIEALSGNITSYDLKVKKIKKQKSKDKKRAKIKYCKAPHEKERCTSSS